MKDLNLKRTAIVAILALVVNGMSLYALNSGPVLYMRANFTGSVTCPHIPLENLKAINQDAVEMKGMTSKLLMSGDAEAGYIFDGHRFFKVPEKYFFSGMGVFGYLGVGKGNSAQKVVIDKKENTGIFIYVDFMPVVSFGVSTKAYFFNNRLAFGVGLGGKLIADTRPQYFHYASSKDPQNKLTGVGELPITDDMMKKMNPLMFSMRTMLEYNIPVLPTTDIVLGYGMQYNIYKPKYLSVPPKLYEAASDGGRKALHEPVPKFMLNSFDVGLNIAIAFKL